MTFQIGDQLIHITHGLGVISAIENQLINGQLTDCYVFSTTQLMVWIPIEDLRQHSLRAPTLPEEFEKSFAILTSPCETLPGDRALRRDQLMSRLGEGQLSAICRLVRDLTHYMRSAKFNPQEKFILERATNSLLTEWSYSLKVSTVQAQEAVQKLLLVVTDGSPLPLVS